jgi:hypothetical protein
VGGKGAREAWRAGEERSSGRGGREEEWGIREPQGGDARCWRINRTAGTWDGGAVFHSGKWRLRFETVGWWMLRASRLKIRPVEKNRIRSILIFFKKFR